MSSPWYQYSYWAERIWACKRPMPARTFVPFDKRSLINFQQRSMCWVPHFTFTVFPPGNLWTFILTKFGLVHSHFPFFLTRFFWWTTESWRTPGSFILHALAESVWKITERLANHFLPKGPQSCFVMGPGPGDRVAVNVGLSRASTSVWGFPLWTNPHHCSQSMERSAFTSCSQAASDKTSLLSKVASSPSTSDHFPEAPNLMPFSFCTTYFFRTSCRFLCMASTTLWFTPKMRWMEASGMHRITRSNKADWVWSDKASGPLPAWKSGCKYWGWILCWQALLLHRYFGLASLQWVCNVDKVPRLHLGQRLPDQSGKILSWISIFTMSMSEAFRSLGTTRRQWAFSLRTPRAGTARFPLTYGTCFQDCVFKLAGRLFCSCIPGTVQAHGVQVEPLLDVADHRRQVFAEEWEPGWVYRHLLSQSCSAALPSRTLASPPLGCCWWRHSTLPMPGCPSRWHGLALGSTSCPVCWLEAEWQCFGPRATNCGVKVETQAFDKDWPYPSSAKAPQTWGPRLKIKDWRFPRSLVRESSIQDWRLKIEDSPGVLLENL